MKVQHNKESANDIEGARKTENSTFLPVAKTLVVIENIFSNGLTASCTGLSLSAVTLMKVLVEVIEPSPN